MLSLNKKTTVNNKVVIPYAVEGNSVYCFDSDSKTIVLPLESFITKKVEPVVEKFVQPVLEPKIEQIVEVQPAYQQEELFEKEDIAEDLFQDESKGNNAGYIPDEEYV